MRIKILLIVVNITQGIGDFWREVNDANTSKAVVYNGFSKTTGSQINLINCVMKKTRPKSRARIIATEIS